MPDGRNLVERRASKTDYSRNRAHMARFRRRVSNKALAAPIGRRLEPHPSFRPNTMSSQRLKTISAVLSLRLSPVRLLRASPDFAAVGAGLVDLRSRRPAAGSGGSTAPRRLRRAPGSGRLTLRRRARASAQKGDFARRGACSRALACFTAAAGSGAGAGSTLRAGPVRELKAPARAQASAPWAPARVRLSATGS